MLAKKLILLMCLLLLWLPVGSVQAEDSEIANYLRLYKLDLPQASREGAQTTYEPITLELDGARVILKEVLYDGCWVFTAAEVVPVDREKTLFFPSSAWGDDKLSGNYGEGERGDDRTILEAAQEDGKRLLYVDIHLKEYDAIPEYLQDHFMRADDVTVLLSGGEVGGAREVLPITWVIVVCEMNPLTGTLNRQTRTERACEMEIPLLAPVETKAYVAKEPQELSFDTIELMKTCLGVYARPQWEQYSPYTLLDAQGREYLGVSHVVGDVYEMDSLPDRLLIESGDTGPIPFEAAGQAIDSGQKHLQCFCRPKP